MTREMSSEAGNSEAFCKTSIAMASSQSELSRDPWPAALLGRRRSGGGGGGGAKERERRDFSLVVEPLNSLENFRVKTVNA